MRFELTVALKYLIPRRRQLSVSIISLISVLVISLVVWLVVLFLSVTEGIEKKWIEELVALNAPVRMTPTAEYYNSYYYQIDTVSLDSNYTTKTIAEKLAAARSDPYDQRFDRELALNFPIPHRDENGRLKDPVKEGFEALYSLPYKGIRPQEYEMSFGNLRLQLLRENTPGELQQTFLTQVSYITSHNGENLRINQMVLPPRAVDYNNLLHALVQTGGNIAEYTEFASSPHFIEAPESVSEKLQIFFNTVEIKELQTSGNGFILQPALFPQKGAFKGVGIIRHGQIVKVVLPQTVQQLAALEKKLSSFGYQITRADLQFEEGRIQLSARDAATQWAQDVQIVLDEQIPFHASLLKTSLPNARALSALKFQIDGIIQQTKISGQTNFEHLEIVRAEPLKESIDGKPLWVYQSTEGKCYIPGGSSSTALGEGLLIAKHFQNNGVQLGDRGHLSYYTLAGSSMQEQQIPVYVAGFYDPGMIPVGNKLIFVDPQISAVLRGNTAIADPMLGNGVNIWLDRLSDAAKFKDDLIQALQARGIDKYWTVQSYHDYEFTRPILEQLQSDKNLFSLIAVIILIVACSNIISMLILLVNDKKKEIGILQSMGASPKRIALIFGLCGFVTGLLSCILGVTAAIFTLRNLQSLVDLLSFLQGREAFQTAFYGSSLPNELSYAVLSLVLIATLVISLLAGMVPAIKAAKIRPTEILKSE